MEEKLEFLAHSPCPGPPQSLSFEAQFVHGFLSAISHLIFLCWQFSQTYPRRARFRGGPLLVAGESNIGFRCASLVVEPESEEVNAELVVILVVLCSGAVLYFITNKCMSAFLCSWFGR